MYNYYGENMKKVSILFIIIFSFFIINVFAEDNKFVIDDGDLLNSSTKEYINLYSEYLSKEAKIDYYVVTVDDLGEYDIDTYAEIVYSNLINKKKDNGLLILVCKPNRMVKVIAGKAISGAITEEVIYEIIDEYIISFMKNNEWDKGIKNGYTAFFKYICYHLNIDTNVMKVSSGYDFLYKYKGYILFVCIWICNTIGYILPKYFIKLFDKKYKVNIIDNIILCVSIVINVIILYYNYLLDNKYLYILLAFEIFSILSGTILNNKNKIIVNNKSYKK